MDLETKFTYPDCRAEEECERHVAAIRSSGRAVAAQVGLGPQAGTGVLPSEPEPPRVPGMAGGAAGRQRDDGDQLAQLGPVR